VNEEVPEKRIINTKTGVPRSPGKPRFPGAQASNKTLTVPRPTEEWKKGNI